MCDVIVHPRVHERHPEISEEDVLYAWEGCLKSIPRIDKDPDEYIAVGVDSSGRMIEMVAKRISTGSFVIYHAFTPPTRKMLRELGLANRR